MKSIRIVFLLQPVLILFYIYFVSNDNQYLYPVGFFLVQAVHVFVVQAMEAPAFALSSSLSVLPGIFFFFCFFFICLFFLSVRLSFL